MEPTAAEAAVLQKVREVLTGTFDIAAEKITLEATFRGTFGMDSLDIVDLVFFLQKEFELKGELDDYREVHTVQKLCRFLLDRTEQGGAS